MKKPMSKTELVDKLVEIVETGGAGNLAPKKIVKTIIDRLPKLIATQIRKREKFTLPGVAIFTKKVKPAVKAKSKKVRNPTTNEMVWQKPRPAMTQVKMRVAKPLKDGVMGG